MTRASRLRWIIRRCRNLLATVVMDPDARWSLAYQEQHRVLAEAGVRGGQAGAALREELRERQEASLSSSEWRQDGFPHCDQRVLHAPGRCEHCDLFPVAQALRKAWGIAYTGEVPPGGQHLTPAVRGMEGRAWHILWESPARPEVWLPCPADFARPRGSESDHRRWAGNVASSESPVNETGASRMLYGDRPGGSEVRSADCGAPWCVANHSEDDHRVLYGPGDRDS